MKYQSLRIIVAEDDMDDKLLLQEALEENGISDQDLAFVENGDELIRMLEADFNRPTIVLLDLNMPKKDGREALREIKNNEMLKHIPIIVLTTSNSEEDIRLAYKEGSNTFFTKPALFNDLIEIVSIIKSYWLEKAAVVI